MICKICGQTLERLMLLALVETAGGKVYPSSVECEHEFVEEDKEE